MSSEADKFVVESALVESDKDVFFKNKKWTYLVDQTSNAGNFGSQIQFDLSNLSNQGQWVNLSEAYIQIPIKTRIYNSSASSQTPASAGLLSTVLKNGFHHFVDQIQVIIDNETVQSNQIFENINATFKVLTEWDADAYNKYSTVLGFSQSLDDFASNSNTTGLNNLAMNTLMPNARGIDLSTSSNAAVSQRQYEQNIDATTSSTILNTIVGSSNARNSGKSQAAGLGANARAAGEDAYVQFVLATIRLKDLSDAIAKLPPVKNIKGFIYINYNAAAVSFTTASSSTVSSWSYSTLQGRSTPVMLQNVATTGFQPASGATNTWTLECNVSGIPSTTSGLTGVLPQINYARLVSPFYEPNPDIESALSQTKIVRYLERYNNTLPVVSANNSLNYTITSGITNPKRLILVPFFTSATNTTPTTATYSPYQSPFEIAPAGTSVYPVLANLQITVGNLQMFSNPVNMDYEMFLNELAPLGQDGGMDNQVASGLLNQRQWSQLYRFYTVDIGRRIIADDGASKSVQISFDNKTNFPVQCLAFILYEREIVVDTAMCKISRNY